MTARFKDDATDRRLMLLVGLVVVSGGFVLTASVNVIAHDRRPIDPYLAAILILCTVAYSSGFSFRVRASNHQISVMSSAVLMAALMQPSAWVVVCAAVGALVATLRARIAPIKVAFNVAKEALAAALAAATLLPFDLAPLQLSTQGDFTRRAIAMLAAAVAYAVLDEGLFLPVLALATGTPLRQRFLAHWDVRLLSRLGALAIAVGATIVLSYDRLLLLAMPPLIYTLSLVSASRVRGREEREAWQRLARTTDQLNSVDLDTVLHTAVNRAAELFSSDEIEIELQPMNRAAARLVRGNSDAVTYDGVPESAPPLHTVQIPMILESHDGVAKIGELRLCFRGPVKLSERETYTLRTFAAALCTAVRNASAFTETQRLAAAHALAASLDPLTGLANRRKLHDYGEEILAQRNGHGVTALLLVDLNHFKEVNDTLGHTAGDRVLVEVARRLARAASPGDLVARLGGDEFAVLFVGLPAPAVAVPRAHSVLAALATPIDLDGMRISVEASGGVAPADGKGVVELLRRADVAMYQAKKDGRRVSVYDPTRDTADVGSLALGGDLARAVTEGQFVVDFQPIVDMGSADIIAAEALARWHHPDLGSLSPARFLDAVERSGQLAAFAESVLDQALIAVASWRAGGFTVPVAVNVSPRSLLDPNFPRMVIARLNARALPAETLVLELTESLTLSQLEVVDDVLGTLREAGVLLALDDFGTGYSSLATLARVQVHELKIDRAFVAAMDSATEAAVIRSTVELGRSLDMLVVAEGVESEEQRRRLWELGCPAGQGHLFARAMPSDVLLTTLQRGFGGRPGALAAPLHEGGSVIRIPRRRTGDQRADRPDSTTG